MGQFKIYLTNINIKPKEEVTTSKGLKWSPRSEQSLWLIANTLHVVKSRK